MRLPHPLIAAAAARPDAPALIVGGEHLSLAALRDAVARRAASLATEGVRPGQVVALDAPVDIDGVVTFHALGWLGAAAAPLGARLTATERHRALTALAPDHLLAREHVVATCPPPREHVVATCRPAGPTGSAHAAPRPWPIDEVRLVILTSGSTGRPRAVRLTTAQIVFGALGSALRLGHLPDDRWLCCLPTHHVGGAAILLRALIYGTTVELHARFDAATVAARLDSGQVTQASLTPPLLTAVLDARAPRPFPSALRTLLLGGAATPPALRERCRALRLPVALTWGMTEAASQIATAPAGDLDAPGLPPLAFATVTADAEGRLVVEGPLTGVAPLRTGDRGHVDEAGRVQVDGRADATIVSGGVNLDPTEIEAVLAGHPAVAAVAVVGLPDARWGARPAALVVARAPVHAEDLRAHARARLSAFKAPDFIAFSETLPRAALGKVARSAVREQLQALQAGAEGLGCLAGHESRQLDEGVLEPHGDPMHPVVLADDVVGEGHRSRGEPIDDEPHHQAVGLANRRRVVSLGVNQRQAEGQPLEERGAPPEGGVQHLLEADVRILEGPPEEHDAGPIDLMEARRDAMLEAHQPLPEDSQ